MTKKKPEDHMWGQIEGVQPKRLYDYLHEIGHMVCGDSCCREHCEFEAHGAAKMLSRVLGLDDVIDWDEVEESMSGYAGRSSNEACGRFRP